MIFDSCCTQLIFYYLWFNTMFAVTITIFCTCKLNMYVTIKLHFLNICIVAIQNLLFQYIFRHSHAEIIWKILSHSKNHSKNPTMPTSSMGTRFRVKLTCVYYFYSGGIYMTMFSCKNGEICLCFTRSFTWIRWKCILKRRLLNPGT